MAGSEVGRISDVNQFLAPGYLEPLEAVLEDGDSQEVYTMDPNKSESDTNFEGRFSTLMSERDKSMFNYGKESNALKMVPRSFS